jgi:hypothetical protein
MKKDCSTKKHQMMKKNNFLIILIVILTASVFHSNAQSPYKEGIGVTLGTTQAFSYKAFLSNHFAIQADLGTKYCYVYGSHLWSVEIAPNFMYEGRLCKGLYGLVGLGGSIGYNWQDVLYIDYYYRVSRHNCKAGANGFFGLEYKFDIPLALQLDFRPGYRCVFVTHKFSDHKFDWGLNFGVRYTF